MIFEPEGAGSRSADGAQSAGGTPPTPKPFEDDPGAKAWRFGDVRRRRFRDDPPPGNHKIRPSFVRVVSSQPNPNEATTARPPTSSAFAVAGSGRGRAAMARVRSTGTCSMYAA